MATPDISVVIIIKDQPEAHKIALHSLLNIRQCNERWEVIVCDNGSKPKMVDIVDWKQYSKNIPISYIDCFSYKNSLGISRNLGIKKAKAPIILCLDGDIILPEMLVQKHLERQNGVPKIIGGSRKWRTIDMDVPSHLGHEESYSLLLNSVESVDPKSRKRELGELTYASKLPSSKIYLACLGFQLSFSKNKDTIFSTELKGWGFEDREFILRQMKIGTYEIVYSPDCQAWHLDSEERSFNPFRNENTDPEIVSQFLRNMVFIVECYKDVIDLDDLYYGLDRVAYNVASDNWRILPSNCKHSADKRSDKYREVTKWLIRKGQMT